MELGTRYLLGDGPEVDLDSNIVALTSPLAAAEAYDSFTLANRIVKAHAAEVPRCRFTQTLFGLRVSLAVQKRWGRIDGTVLLVVTLFSLLPVTPLHCRHEGDVDHALRLVEAARAALPSLQQQEEEQCIAAVDSAASGSGVIGQFAPTCDGDDSARAVFSLPVGHLVQMLNWVGRDSEEEPVGSEGWQDDPP